MKSWTSDQIPLRPLYSHLSASEYSHLPLSENLKANTEIKEISWRRKYTVGWRFGVTTCAVSATSVFLINLIVFIWAILHNGDQGEGKGTLYSGPCESTRKLNTGVHLLINILSTMLLGASNYCMQCMSAPTRTEIDRAHARGKWLDVGVQSVRNLFRISKKRAALYCLLGISSLPLHLFYNSTVFSSIAANEYFVYSVSEAFIDPKSSNFTAYGYTTEWSNQIGLKRADVAWQMFNKSRDGNLTRLDTAACLNTYAQDFQTNRGSLLLVAPDNAVPQFDNSTAALWFEADEKVPNNLHDQCPYDWMCNADRKSCVFDGQCSFRLGPARSNISTWQPFQKQILYCLSEPAQEHCRLEYSIQLAVVVIILNAFKAVIMIYLAFGVLESPIMTVGDAVASFLEREDIMTRGMCLATRKDIVKSIDLGDESGLTANTYSSAPQRRFAAASTGRWVLTLGLITLAIIIVLGLLIYGVTSMTSRPAFSTLLSLGLGAVTPTTFISWSLPSTGPGALVLNVLIANTPQLILSFIYFAYNSLFTSLSLSAEFSLFAFPSHRKGLRVSAKPTGAQRSTYFLQLPYRFAGPLIATSGLLHWLVSQSIFLVAVDAFSIGSDDDDVSKREHTGDLDYMTCGYSPLAMMLVLIVGMLMIIAAVGSGWRRLASGMPIAGSCSAAISAACHGDFAEGEGSLAAESKVQWGVISREQEGYGAGDEGEVGHCTFSDGPVGVPMIGRLYAGLKV